MSGTQSPQNISTKLQRIAELARRAPKVALTAVAHHIDFGRALKRVSLWCRTHLHDKIAKQHEHLVRMVRGHYGYFGITGNAPALSAFLYEVTHAWQKWLHRRSGRGAMPWPRFLRVLKRYPLPPPVVVHSVYRT